jgi:hypothetical protein
VNITPITHHPSPITDHRSPITDHQDQTFSTSAPGPASSSQAFAVIASML